MTEIQYRIHWWAYTDESKRLKTSYRENADQAEIEIWGVHKTTVRLSEKQQGEHWKTLVYEIERLMAAAHHQGYKQAQQDMRTALGIGQAWGTKGLEVK